MAGEGLPVQAATRVLNVTDSGYYAWRGRGPSARAVRHALVTETIRQVHLASRGTYGYRGVHAELTMGRGLLVGHGTVELLIVAGDNIDRSAPSRPGPGSAASPQCRRPPV
jgi:putative transposase